MPRTKSHALGTIPTPRSTDDLNIGRLLHTALRAYNARALAGIRSMGHDDATLAHAAILPHLDGVGTRVTVLAARAGMTKQSAAQLVKELEVAGYLVRRPDPADRRAELICLTKRGLRFRDNAYTLKQVQERELSKTLGTSGKESLARLLAIFPWCDL